MTDTTKKTEPDGALASMLVTVVAAGLVMAVAAVALMGARAAIGVAVGSGIAVANLAVLGLTVRTLLGGDPRKLPWTFMAVFKIVFLFGGIYLLVRAGVVDLLPLALGYGSLPLGIFISQLKPAPSAKEGG